jgi:hypothetical protein
MTRSASAKEAPVLFHVTYTPRPGWSETLEKRTLAVFTQWQPPAGYEFKALYDYADGDGGVAIVEAASAEAILEAQSVFSAYFEFRARPIVDAEKAVGILQKALAWRDSVR